MPQALLQELCATARVTLGADSPALAVRLARGCQTLLAWNARVEAEPEAELAADEGDDV